MTYLLLADIAVLVHTSWTLFLVIGAYWGVRLKWVRIVHLVGLAYAAITIPFDLPCPLTTLELYLRSRHGPHLAYPGHFIIHYASKILHIRLPFYFIEICTFLICIFNLWLYYGKGALPLRQMLRGSH